MVEFALILPLLLVLFLGIADFGRVFHAGIVAEAAARNAAEIVAEEYRRNPPGTSLSRPGSHVRATLRTTALSTSSGD